MSYFGNAQDVLLLGSEVVVPAPTPTTTDAGGAIIGPYASFTGTSMATPLVAGVVAQLLQANPDLSPAEVRAILRETAVMPAGKNYANHGFALGRGLIEASRAGATAVRLGDGLSLRNALLTATAAGDPLVLNDAAPDGGPLGVDLSVPPEVHVGAPATLTAEAFGGSVYSLYSYSWDLTGDAAPDATGASVTWVFPSVGGVLVSVTAEDGTSIETVSRTVDVLPLPGIVFSDGMEAGPGNWIVENVGTTGVVSGWDLRTTNPAYLGGFFGPASGSGFWHSGVRDTPATGGWAYVPGADARLSLASPIDLAGRSTSTLYYNVVGQSMAPLVVEARSPGGAWAAVDSIAGNFFWGGGSLLYTERQVDLSLYAGGEVEFRFRHTAPLPTDPIGLILWSFFDSHVYGGWGIDDVRLEAQA